MKPRDRKELYKKATGKWGSTAQKIVAIEEFSELINEVSKLLNKKNKRGMLGLVDEIADCRIMLEQLESMYGLEDAVRNRMSMKLDKLSMIIKGEVEHPHK